MMIMSPRSVLSDFVFTILLLIALFFGVSSSGFAQVNPAAPNAAPANAQVQESEASKEAVAAAETRNTAFKTSYSEAITVLSNAATKGLEDFAKKGALVGKGAQLLNLLTFAIVMWTLLKVMMMGGGLVEALADLVPVAVAYAIATVLMSPDFGMALDSFISGAVSLVTGAPVQSIAQYIQSGALVLFESIVKIWSLPTVQGESPSSFLGIVADVAASLMSKLTYLLMAAGATLLLLLTFGVYMAHLVISQVGIYIAMALAPIFVPFLVFRPTSFLFEGWLRFAIGACLTKGIALMMLVVVGKMFEGISQATKNIVVQGAGGAGMFDIAMFSVVFLLSGIAAMLMSSAPTVANGLISGGGGGMGFAGWAQFLRSPASSTLTRGMGRGSSGGSGSNGKKGTGVAEASRDTRAGRATAAVARAADTTTRAMPNVLKPVSAAVAAVAKAPLYGTDKMQGGKAASRDMTSLAGAPANSAGNRVIERDMSGKSDAYVSSYQAKLNQANRPQSKADVGPPRPNFVVQKPGSSSTTVSKGKDKGKGKGP
jgi:type IV secretion system protein TrbL